MLELGDAAGDGDRAGVIGGVIGEVDPCHRHHDRTPAPGGPEPLAGVLVMCDRSDGTATRADAQALALAGATVRCARDPELDLSPAEASRPVVVWLVDADIPPLQRRQLAGLWRAPGDAFRIVVGQGLGSQARTRLLLSGADDCLDGPYLPEELVARTAALVRRRAAARRELLVSAGLELDTGRRSAHVHGVPLVLTQREFELLAHLMRHADLVLSREQLLSQVWGFDFGSTDTVTVHVRRLRFKVEDDPARPQRILTVRGFGYMFVTAGGRHAPDPHDMSSRFRKGPVAPGSFVWP